MSQPLRLRICQTAPEPCAPEANAAEAEALVHGAPQGSLVVFPELSLTGYGLGARLGEFAIPRSVPPPIRVVGAGTTALVGFPEAAPDGRIYNAAGWITGDGWGLVHRKAYLPTYGSFQEGRFFAPGDSGPPVFSPAPGWTASVLVCEEIWHPALAYLAAAKGADLLVVMAAGPGRGPTQPRHGEPDPGVAFGSWETWRLLARSAALIHGMYVALCNSAGVEDGVTFAGGSLLVHPSGEIVFEAPAAEAHTEDLTLDREAVLNARRPFSHLRDEDPGLLRRELDQLPNRR